MSANIKKYYAAVLVFHILRQKNGLKPLIFFCIIVSLC